MQGRAVPGPSTGDWRAFFLRLLFRMAAAVVPSVAQSSTHLLLQLKRRSIARILVVFTSAFLAYPLCWLLWQMAAGGALSRAART